MPGQQRVPGQAGLPEQQVCQPLRDRSLRTEPELRGVQPSGQVHQR